MATTSSVDGAAKDTLSAKIVIVGAGVAGLAAASRLKEYGFVNVTIVEARDRPGGRTHSKCCGESCVELGAQWIHGQEGNAVYKIAKENDLVDEDCPHYLEQFYHWPQLNEEEKKVALEVNALVLEALDECQKLSLSGVKNVSPAALQKSLGHFLRFKFLEYLNEKSFSPNLLKVAEASYDWAVRLQNEIQGCSSLTDVSSLFIGQYHECDGNNLTELKAGYSLFVEYLLNGFPSQWLNLSMPVNLIKVSLENVSSAQQPPELKDKKSLSQLKTSFPLFDLGTNKPVVTVACDDGSKLLADHVIVTLPLGCMKANAAKMFDPPLSERKMTAIQSLGYGVVNKIYLLYERPFWDPQEVFQVLWLDGFNHCANKVMSDNMTAWVTHSDLAGTWHRYIHRFNAIRNQSKLLVAWIAGEGAKYMENLTKSEIMSKCHKVLTECVGRKNIRPPIDAFWSTWNSDLYSLGSYSYISVACDATGSLPRDLADPVCVPVTLGGTEITYPVLLFAGEATHPHFFSTVHGAYESGMREADRLVEFYFKGGRNQESYVVRENPPREVFLQDNPSVMSSLSQSSMNPKIVIIGAGAAGLSAAQRLTAQGFTNFIILEAQKTAGGRILSYFHDDKVLELGAQWVHGESGNDLYKFAKSRNLLADPRVDYSVEGKGHFCTDRGTIIPQNVVDEVTMVLDRIKEQLSSGQDVHHRVDSSQCNGHCWTSKTSDYLSTSLNDPFDLQHYSPREVSSSVGEYFKTCFTEYLEQQKDNEEMMKIKWGIYDWYWRFEVIDNACYTLDELSFKSYTEFEECPGVWHINFKNGYSSVVSALLENVPESNIAYEKPVTRIHWDTSSMPYRHFKPPRSSVSNSKETFRGNSLFVECADGEMISCSHVLVTASVGYLKAHIDSLFVPSLPEKKKYMLDSIGFGTIDKIYLIFEKPFWEPTTLGFQLIWMDEREDKGKTLIEKNGDWWLHGISGFDTVYKNPNILVGWIGSKEAEYMEKLPQKEIGSACTRLLRRFLNKPDIPEPVSVVRSQWHSNPYILGGYSNRSIPYDDSEKALEMLFEPLMAEVPFHKSTKIEWPLVLFAGEATDKEYYSTVHGAMRSGFREADRLISFWSSLDRNMGQLPASIHPRL